MVFKVKPGQTGYLKLVREDGSEGDFKPVIVLSTITEKTFTDTHKSYRVVDCDGEVDEVGCEELVGRKEYLQLTGKEDDSTVDGEGDDEGEETPVVEEKTEVV